MTDDCRERPPWSSTAPSSLISIDDIAGAHLAVKFGLCDLNANEGAPYANLPRDTGRACNRDFFPLLESWATNLQYFSHEYGRYGAITQVVHGGIYGTAPSNRRATFHNTGEAIDLKWIDWSGGRSCRPCNGQADVDSSITAHRRMVGVEASLRKYFGVVVGRNDANHADHFHADVECPVGFSTTSEDKRLFARDCIMAFTDNTFAVTHDSSAWNDSTDENGLASLLTALGMDCFNIKNNVSEYLIFLDYIMMHAFADRSGGHYRWGGLLNL